MSATEPLSANSPASGICSHRQLRDAFGRFATGVTIVTTAGVDGPRAITVNSFSSVSLDPPLVLWSIDRTSLNFEPFVSAKDYSIHVLGRAQETLCMQVSRNPKHLHDVELPTSSYGVPVLPDCLARYDCSRETLHDAGDHVIIVGLVKQVSVFEDVEPLTFYRGGTGTFVATGSNTA